MSTYLPNHAHHAHPAAPAPCEAPPPRVVRVIAGVQRTLVRYWRAAVVTANGTVTAGAPIDLTGYTGRFVVMKPGQHTPIIDLASATGGLLLTPSTGRIEIPLSRALLNLMPGESTFHLILTSASGLDHVLDRGRFVVEPRGLPL